MTKLQLASDGNWLKRGRQKSAVAQVLRRPMTSSEIWRVAQRLNPHIQLRDVWFVLRQFQQRGLVCYFNPQDATGKIFFWTSRGLCAVKDAFNLEVAPAPSDIDWQDYSRVARARLRQLILMEFTRAHFRGEERKTASRIRRNLREQHSVSLNSVIRVLTELRALKLIEIAGEGEKRGQKVYRLTKSGKRIADYLSQNFSRTD